MIRRIVLVTICSFLCGLAAADEPTSARIEELIPANATLVLLVDDAPTLIKQWQASPYAQLWNDPEMQAFFSPLRKQMKIDEWDELVKEETGRELDELLGMATGEVAFYISDLGSLFDADKDVEDEGTLDDDVPPFGILARVGENADEMRSFLEEQNEDDDETTVVIEEFRGVDLHLERSSEGEDDADEGGWAITNGIAVAAYPNNQLRTLVDAILEGETENPITTVNAYRSARDVVPSGDAIFVVNLEQIMPAIRDFMSEELQSEGGTPPFLNGEVVYNALGLEMLESVFVGVDIEAEISRLDFGLTYSDDKGLVKVLAYGPGEAPRSSIIPANATVFGSTAFDFQVFWEGLEEIINSINPGLLAMGSAQLQIMTSGAGIELDLRRDLLENLGGEIITIQAEQDDVMPGETISALQTNQVVAISIKQRESFELMLETVKTLIGTGAELFETSDYLDTTIYTLKIPQSGEAAQAEEAMPNISYAVTDGFFLLCIGDVAPLQSVLVTMKRPGDSVWKRPEVIKALATLPSGAAGISFQDVQSTANTVFNMLATISSMDDEGEGLVDPESIPDPEVVSKYFYATAGGLYKEGGRILFRSRTLSADQ